MTQELIDSFANRGIFSHNIQLAHLDLTMWGLNTLVRSSDDLLSACKEYFERNSSKAVCFDDLQGFVEMLDQDRKREFRRFAGEHATSLAPKENASGVSRI